MFCTTVLDSPETDLIFGDEITLVGDIDIRDLTYVKMTVGEKDGHLCLQELTPDEMQA